VNKHLLFAVGLSNTNYLLAWENFSFDIFPDSFGCIFQAPLGADQGMNLSCLHLGAMMGQQAEKQRVVWQTLFSAISGGGLRLLTE
jgi:hypothetical protein